MSLVAAGARKLLQTREADARTRTGDPFITSYGQLSLRVIASHLRRIVEPNPLDWRWLAVTPDDNLVDPW
jgi:hypothetical protein